MRDIDTIIVGGGQAGLALSRSLAQRGIEHVVLERGRVGERWRSERWASLRLLTPRHLSRLAGWEGEGGEPGDFMTRDEVVGYLAGFADAFEVPVEEGVTVRSVERIRDGGAYRVDTDHGTWRSRRVVIATGECQAASVPPFAGSLGRGLHQVVPTAYRSPQELPEGGVLVVGASATGIQLADEIHASGRPVTLAVGRHTRLPRTYRGLDILEWFHRMGILDEAVGDVGDADASRSQPSMQLVGSDDGRTLDLGVLRDAGVRLVGRAVGVDGSRMAFADDLVETVAAADVKLARLRLRIDGWIEGQGLTGRVGDPEPFRPSPLPSAPTRLDLRDAGIRTVVWATGFRRSYPWLKVPVLDGRGELVHRGGDTPAPGLHALGFNFMRHRASSFLLGVGRDAEALARRIAARRRTPRPEAAGAA